MFYTDKIDSNKDFKYKLENRRIEKQFVFVMQKDVHMYHV